MRKLLCSTQPAMYPSLRLTLPPPRPHDCRVTDTEVRTSSWLLPRLPRRVAVPLGCIAVRQTQRQPSAGGLGDDWHEPHPRRR